ncbi:hypothetical protein [Polynucleobacter sp. es-EL-1]|uniref:hypothetical protein n=1 Tax=Polynucleobacter sp. es-EL-1 TaxID=1855652 RepID=UPI001BFD74AB|nr:hypothetical protein [Polynucleobacter sp. es-EL-1]QWE10862.1 hypothetical protein FD974_01585 [Polynucleobacter sp. es-EL-1]
MTKFQKCFDMADKRLGGLIFIVVCLAYLSKVIYALYFSTADFLAATIADDGFYYWLIAKNLWQLGMSSADYGQTLTSGYHPLWAWLLMPLTAIGGSQIQEMRIFISLSVLISILSFVLMYRIFPANQIAKFFVYGLVVSAFSFQINSMSGLEWPLILLCNVIYFYCLLRVGTPLLIFLGLGVFASLSRTDFGAIPLIVFIVSAVFYYFNKDKKTSYLMKASLATLLGATIGLIITFSYFYLVTGQFSQGSALVKHMWAKEGFLTPLSIVFQFARALFFIPDMPHSVVVYVHEHTAQLLFAFFVSFFLVLLGLYKVRLTIKSMNFNNHNIVLIVSSLFILVFYLLFYGLNTVEVQPWYTAQIIIPLVFLLLQLITFIFGQGSWSFMRPVATFVFLLSISMNLITSFLNTEAFPDQIELKNLGNYLIVNQEKQIVGYSGNGVVSFFGGQRVINLDGLVNNEIYAYMPKNLPCYLLDKNIKVYNGFGASERFFGLDLTSIMSSPLKGSPLPMYLVDEEKIRATYGCLSK